ncbi:hypothetical protein [Brevibacillus gelatini]|nr:hypothetical protein [Brevibacillus gelatini]
MTVAELIEQLSKCDQNADVLIAYSNGIQLSTIEKTEDKGNRVYIVESK